MCRSLRRALLLLAVVSTCLAGCAAEDPIHGAVPSGDGGSSGGKLPDPCADGDLRSCKINLPTQGDIVHCMYGVARCDGVTWGAALARGGAHKES